MMTLNSRLKSRKKKAFTLIELLVVIAIIALLLAVLMPALQSAKEAGKTIACASHIKQWGMIVSFFATDNDGRFPDADWNDDNQKDPRGQWWLLPFRPYYLDQPEILICGKAQRVQDGKALYAAGNDGRYFTENRNECWGRRIMEDTKHPDVGEWVWSSYAPNAWIMDPKDGYWGNMSDADLPNFWGKFIDMKIPSRVPIFLDSRSVDAWPKDTDRPSSEEFGGTGSQGSMRAFTLLRHNRSVNSVFGDGHVTKVPITDLWKLKWHKNFMTSNPYTQDDAPWPNWMR